jgi:epoxyqueuosine reductase
MTTSSEIKVIAKQLGADLCGIAPIERFKNAPIGFHPSDVYAETQSVIVFAKHESVSTAQSKSKVAYTFACEMAYHEVHQMTMKFVFRLEDNGITAIPIPSEPYEYWDTDTMTGKGIISLKHAGYLAGLGVIGNNTLLHNLKFGNLIRLGAILTNAQFEPDELDNHTLNCNTCNICVKNCPVSAIENGSVSQLKCRTNAYVTNKKGYSLCECKACRMSCPHMGGFSRVQYD